MTGNAAQGHRKVVGGRPGGQRTRWRAMSPRWWPTWSSLMIHLTLVHRDLEFCGDLWCFGLRHQDRPLFKGQNLEDPGEGGGAKVGGAG